MSVVKVSTADGGTQKAFYVDSYSTLVDKLEGKLKFRPKVLLVENVDDRGARMDSEEAFVKMLSKYGRELNLIALRDGETLKGPSPVEACDGCSSLESGMHLEPGMYMESTNKRYKAVFQTDGNFVLYAFPGVLSVLWATNTASSSAQKLVMQRDGNLVLYDKDNKALWASYTHGKGPSKATLQDDGNFVIYDASGNATWSTRTGELCKSCSTLKPGQLLTLGGQMMSPNQLYKAVLELDGIFAIYKGRSTVWATNTRDRSARNIVMQRDGNLVIYDKDNKALWASHTHGKGESSLTLEDSGRLVVHNSRGAATWSVHPREASKVPKWKKSDGSDHYFEKTAGSSKWIEYQEGKIHAHFEEISQSKDAVVLRRHDGLLVRLTASAGYWGDDEDSIDKYFTPGFWAEE